MMISTTPPSLVDLIPAGVVTGDNLCLLYSLARKHGCAIPAFTCHSLDSCEAVLGAARVSRSPVVMIRLMFAPGIVSRASENTSRDKGPIVLHHTYAAAKATVDLAMHVRSLAVHYGVLVVLQAETHCYRQLGGWCEELLEANEAFLVQHGEPLFSSHLLNLTGCGFDDMEYVAIAAKYLERLSHSKTWLTLQVGHGRCGVTEHNESANDSNTAFLRQLWTVRATLTRISSAFSLGVDKETIEPAVSLDSEIHKCMISVIVDADVYSCSTVRDVMITRCENVVVHVHFSSLSEFLASVNLSGSIDAHSSNKNDDEKTKGLCTEQGCVVAWGFPPKWSALLNYRQYGLMVVLFILVVWNYYKKTMAISA